MIHRPPRAAASKLVDRLETMAWPSGPRTPASDDPRSSASPTTAEAANGARFSHHDLEAHRTGGRAVVLIASE